MRNVSVNLAEPTAFNKNMVHKSISFLKKELNFNLSSLVINFVSSQDILRINAEYLNHNYTTDIITFGYSETNSDIDGEIYISVPDALNNANKYNNSLKQELVRLVTHGVLHLLGYDDQEKDSRRKMKSLENELVIKQKEIWS